MAKYNLLDDDDIFEEKEENEEETLSKRSSVESNEELDINIDDDDFEIEPASLEDDQFQTDVSNERMEEEALERGPEGYDEEPHFEPAQENEAQEEKPKYIVDDYEDDKQEGLNYKPIIKIAVGVLILIGIYFILDIFVLSEQDEIAEEAPAKTEEQLRQEREEARRSEFISVISGKLNTDVQNVSSVVDDVIGSANLSSILFYGNSFLCEVFGTSRDAIAKVNIAFKKSGKPFEVISSQTRPGSKGGVLSLYKLEVPATSAKGQSNIKFIDVAAFENWFQSSASSGGLKVISISNKALANDESFNKYQVEATINGSIQECNNFLKKLAAEGNQAAIHKLNLMAMDQRTFKISNYQLKLILELFV